MRKILIICLTIMLLVLPNAYASVSLSDSPVNQDSVIAANEFGASAAYFSPLDDYIYYLKTNSDGTNVIVFDASSSEYRTVKSFSPEAGYISIGVDCDSNIYLLRRDNDETAKSGIVCLKKENDDYVVTESLFPGASGEMIPVSFEFSPYSSMGAIRLWINHQGEYISFISPLSVFWGSLMGMDELIYIVPGDLKAKVQNTSEFFDAYGYQTDKAAEFLNNVESGEYLTPTDVSLSPNGNMLLLLVPYQDQEIVYVMDLYTYALEILYLPEPFEGSVSWTYEGNIVTIDENGVTSDVEWNGFSAGSWNTSEGFDVNSDMQSDWNNVTQEDLGDWS